MDRLLLDANVLFSAAYREDAGVRRLWQLAEIELATSAYAVEEARRNLSTAEQRADLNELLEAVGVLNVLADPAGHPGIEDSGLPEKDLPILRAAVASGCTHLITGDREHFGYLFGKRSPASSSSVRPTTSRKGVRRILSRAFDEAAPSLPCNDSRRLLIRSAGPSRSPARRDHGPLGLGRSSEITSRRAPQKHALPV